MKRSNLRHYPMPVSITTHYPVRHQVRDTEGWVWNVDLKIFIGKNISFTEFKSKARETWSRLAFQEHGTGWLRALEGMPNIVRWNRENERYP